jgi:MFS family permease
LTLAYPPKKRGRALGAHATGVYLGFTLGPLLGGIMICVFAALVFGGRRVIAEFGVGLASAVFLDAFVLRTFLVPALTHLLGKANWWLPRQIERYLPHLAVESPEDAEQTLSTGERPTVDWEAPYCTITVPAIDGWMLHL